MKKRILSYSLEQEDGAYVARCLEIEVASDGNTEVEAVANLEEALALYGEPEGGSRCYYPTEKSHTPMKSASGST